ncbi:MAG: ATPase [Gomphosphaeria aponina SAG 52.96 = DSM 107014]|uniref:ATPase n=1 Tax=Gomphosphaeria aponina SAG 52.96 = DSM 107014 TaxID=1521640 RepID=A0A941GQL1_9CHRO|nr:ATPase [Gomphosphaeria aponina SAG 52.96 = DSM 107014]
MTPPIVKRFLIAFDEHKLLGFFIFAFIWGASFVLALQPPPASEKPTYRAVGQLSLNSSPPIFTSTGEQLQQQGRIINTGMLLAPRVLEAVAKKMQLSSQEMQEILDEKLQIRFPEIDEPPIITIGYEDNKEAIAKLILQAFMDEMVEQSRLLNTAQLRQRIISLEERMNYVQQELKVAENAFYGYITGEGAALLAIQDGSLFTGITNSQQEQRNLLVILEGIEGEIATLQNQLGLTPEAAYTSSALSADPIIANLRAQIMNLEIQLEVLRPDLRQAHPTIVELEKQKQANENLLQQRAQELITNGNLLNPSPEEIRKNSSLDPARQELANRLVALQSQRDAFLRQLESIKANELELRRQYEQFPERQMEQARLTQAVQSQRILYQTILAALVDARAAEAETTGSLTILQAPFVPLQEEELGPGPILIILAGGAIAFFAATGVIFLLATLDDRLHTPGELREALTGRDVPLLGQLPWVMSFDRHGKRIPVFLDEESTYLPFYERFRSNLRRFGSEPAKVILITSINNHEGKSVSAYNLAIASALAGKRTLLVEADLRSPSAAQWLNAIPDEQGKIEPLSYYASGNCIALVPEIENLYLLPSPGPLPNATAVIESDELQLLLKDARGRFDLVIVDTPSLLRCNDALLLESLTDGIVLVTRPGTTRRSMLTETIDEFIDTDLSLLGATINGVENLAPPPELPINYIEAEIETDDTEEVIGH